jgi:hypothetical protein
MPEQLVVDTHYFPNVGYQLSKTPKWILDQLTVDCMEKLNSKGDINNDRLAGNISLEYDLTDTESYDILSQYTLGLANHFCSTFEYPKNSSLSFDGKTPQLDNLWVNFQNKHEYNPIHTHSGDLSFVIWLDIPYNIHQEQQLPHIVYANTKTPGAFSFVYTNALGEIYPLVIDADKEYNGNLCMFPANMNHMVYPFFTSDNMRISVSGNISYV